MSPPRNRRLSVLRALGLLGAMGVWAVACGGPQPLASAGAVCFRADECQAGLACIPESAGASKHVCSADLTRIVSMVDGAAPDGDLPEAMGGGSGAPAAGGAATAGAKANAGAAGKPAAGGAPGVAGSASAGAPAGGASAGAPTAGAASGGAPAGGAPAGGAPAGGAPAGGSSTAGGGAANGGSSAGTGL